MEDPAVIAVGAVVPNVYSHVYATQVDGPIAMLHLAFVGKGKRDCFPSAKLSIKLLALRNAKLMRYLQSCFFRTGDVELALIDAFKQMDLDLEKEMEGQVHVSELSDPRTELYWRTQFNTLVVVKFGGWVHVAGDAQAQVSLCRDGKDKVLTSDRLSYCIALDRDILYPVARYFKLHKELAFYCKEKLLRRDRYLVIASDKTLYYLRGSKITPVLQTRVDVFGLEEACKQIVGRYLDVFPKVLIVVPLQKTMTQEERKEAQKSITDEDEESDERKEAQESITDEDEESDDEGWPKYVEPLVDGRPQHPEPMTSLNCFPDRAEPSVTRVEQRTRVWQMLPAGLMDSLSAIWIGVCQKYYGSEPERGILLEAEED